MRTRTKVALILILAPLLATSIISYKDSQPKVATYKIYEQVNYGDKFFDWVYNVKEDKRHHPIIKIVSDVEVGKAASNCTAFVINDTTAITAGHCMNMTQDMINIEFPRMNALSKIKEQQLLKRITSLETKCGDDPRCLRLLDQADAMLARELKSREIAAKIKADTFKVYNVEGIDTKVVVTAYSKHTTRDYGFLQGDFKNFKKMYIRSGWHVKIGDTLRACGYFGGKLPPACVDFKALGNHNFLYAGESVWMRGVSGGPVIDHLGYVVGIAASVSKDFVLMEPIIGVVDITTDEQRKRIDEQNK